MTQKDIALPPKPLYYRCFKCEFVDNSPKNFYKTYSKDIFENNGYMPICKDCLAKLYNKYLLRYHDIHKSIKRICIAFDLYYADKIVDDCMAKSDTTPPIGEYIRKLNTAQYKGKTFDHSLEDGFLFDETDKKYKARVSKIRDDDEGKSNRIPEHIKARWGSGLSKNDYKALEEHYKYLKDANPNCDSNQEIFIMDLCQIKMQQTNAMRAGRTDDYIKLTESYRKTFSQAGLKTTTDNDEKGNESWGSWINIISKYTPEEYYKDKELYKDFDGIGSYFKRFVLRPLRNLQFGTVDRDEEFFVDDVDV